MSKTSKPVSLAPVKSLGGSLGSPISDASVPTAATVTVHQPVAATEMAAKVVQTPVVSAHAAPAKLVDAKPIAPQNVATPAPAKKAAAKTPVIAKTVVPPKPAVAEVVAVKVAAAETATAKTATAKPTTVVAKPAIAIIPAKTAVVAPVQIAAAASKSATPKAAIVAKNTTVAKPTVAKPAAVMPAAVMPAAVMPFSAKPAAPKVTPTIAPANPMAAFAGLFDPKAMMSSFSLPRFPTADLNLPMDGTDLLTTMASQVINATRTLGEVHAALLDHGVAQLKAGMTELEACARSTTPSEVVVIQARALRRSADDLTDTIKTVSAKASKGFAKR
ncbi:MAG: hypothetical protein ACRCUE_00835 [Bosea sp. (in: a-proteobacteria)]